MNLHQFRFVYEAARRNLNLTETAKALHTSQPGISKAIMELEEELGVDIFVRHGKRLKRVTEPGQQVLQSIDIILRELGNLRRIGDEYAMQDAGTLSIATTHTQARYVLPEPVAALRKKYPKVSVSLHQGTPEQVAQMVLDETADIGLATESLSDFPELVTLPCYEWQHVVVMPASHPLTQVSRLTLEQLAAEPLISYHPSFTGRKRIDSAFAQRGLTPNVVLEAIDADVIKTYTRLGLGVGLVAEMAVKDDPTMGTPGSELVWRPVGHLFGPNMARLAFKRGAYLRQFVLAFAELISDRLTKALIMQAMQSPANSQSEGDYGL
ncbi:transcriptional regulator [Aquabacterium sp. NJ1]|uniref:CysB family HTH-type transcriptional regulator n=1 Tax=Aquabacterium sp. NJ1 TaxID=1538295 RepID=UPI00052DFC11|nr:CysB family HTH-type transcriptional regulator [Aquabacterium sp. NJ1]KGM41470.1 transcriptional regulator [Aquabacterium sp. NJ1]